VTCGSVIKLMHDKTKAKLHSHDIAYGSGSGQQSVTGFQGGDDANSFWIIRGTKAKPCPQGSLIAKGTPIRLQHHSTRKWLHSHNFKSPLTNNQEVRPARWPKSKGPATSALPLSKQTATWVGQLEGSSALPGNRFAE